MSEKPRRILLLAALARPELAAESARLAPLVAQGCEVLSRDLDSNDDLAAIEFDIAVVVGGDGSILRAGHQMGRRQRPVIGVNLGKLGFLADLLPQEFVAELPKIFAGQFTITDHLMYDCRVLRAGKVIEQRLGLNEVAVFAGAPFSIVDIDLYVDSELVTTYSCDGLIVSTPIGSTAHNLSAGGPILRQDLQAFVVSPISPHTLTNRPVVDTAARVYEIVVPRPHAGTALVADGRMVCALTADDRIRVERSDARFRLVELSGHTYYRKLREKLGWGGRLERRS